LLANKLKTGPGGPAFTTSILPQNRLIGYWLATDGRPTDIQAYLSLTINIVRSCQY
jgi:hypothetical protein